MAAFTKDLYNHYIKYYIDTYKNDIDNNNFQEMFDEADRGECADALFSFLYDEVGIDPLPYMTTLPSQLFSSSYHELDAKLVVPKNITNISTGGIFEFCSYRDVTIDSVDELNERMFFRSKTMVLRIQNTERGILSFNNGFLKDSRLKRIIISDVVETITFDKNFNWENVPVTILVPEKSLVLYPDCIPKEITKIAKYIVRV